MSVEFYVSFDAAQPDVPGYYALGVRVGETVRLFTFAQVRELVEHTVEQRLAKIIRSQNPGAKCDGRWLDYPRSCANVFCEAGCVLQEVDRIIRQA